MRAEQRIGAGVARVSILCAAGRGTAPILRARGNEGPRGRGGGGAPCTISVVLPQPDGPMSAPSEPAGKRADTPCSSGGVPGFAFLSTMPMLANSSATGLMSNLNSCPNVSTESPSKSS
eukprot:593756-Prymnesium_polylepis.1